MDNSAVSKAMDKYNLLFPTNESKAAAFDKLAEKYYYANFGTTAKTDIDTLMFSIYIEQILNVSENDMETYSDYTLSKLLGITQSRVSNLKVKKELQYPYEGFAWEKSFARILNNYRYEGGKIRIFIPDKNLYYEIKNAIENAGGYVEAQINSTLLQISPEYFVDLIMAVTKEEDRDKVRKQIKMTLKDHNRLTEDFDRKSIGEQLKESAPETITAVAADLIESCIPVVGKPLGTVLNKLVHDIRNR